MTLIEFLTISWAFTNLSTFQESVLILRDITNNSLKPIFNNLSSKLIDHIATRDGPM